MSMQAPHRLRPIDLARVAVVGLRTRRLRAALVVVEHLQPQRLE